MNDNVDPNKYLCYPIVFLVKYKTSVNTAWFMVVFYDGDTKG